MHECISHARAGAGRLARPLVLAAADRQSSDIDISTVALPSSAQDPVILGDLYDDAQAVVEVLKAVEGPAVVVGHSCGATPVTEAAATMGNVKGIIYFTALMQDAGDFVLSLVGGTFPS
ncbi:hypothetical protein [Streptomyces cadmiisoli]|uniref:hypothetical protein n=1 Tax=Streptomyces cadmiisoli TaxID=2184053 RepID=UPI003D72A67F